MASGKKYHPPTNCRQLRNGALRLQVSELTQLACNCHQQLQKSQPEDARHSRPQLYLLNFDDLPRSRRCNPVATYTMREIADAGESARTLLLTLNRDWAGKQGDYWVDSAILFFTALIWYLRRYEGGRYCTLPHVISLLQVDYADLFSILRTEPEIADYISPFLSAYQHSPETLDNQISSLKIAVSRLSSPALYYVMSGNDFTLDLNDPKRQRSAASAATPNAPVSMGPLFRFILQRSIG
jgi:hypothetical protein